ncbi:MAG: ABC transporter permease, partial [Nitrospirales bacterium]
TSGWLRRPTDEDQILAGATHELEMRIQRMKRRLWLGTLTDVPGDPEKPWLKAVAFVYKRMLILCGLFFPVAQLPVWLRPLSYALPLTYGADLLHGSIHRAPHLPLALDFGMLIAFCVVLFAFSLRNVRRKWIV